MPIILPNKDNLQVRSISKFGSYTLWVIGSAYYIITKMSLAACVFLVPSFGTIYSCVQFFSCDSML